MNPPVADTTDQRVEEDICRVAVEATRRVAEVVSGTKSFYPVGPPRVLTGHVLQRALIFLSNTLTG